MDFESRFEEVFSAFYDVFKIDSFTRIGLRYVNAICPSALEMEDDAQIVLKGPVSDLFSRTMGTFRAGSCILDRDIADGISSRTAVGTIVFSDNQPGYAIDNDVYTCIPTETKDVVRILRNFNEISNELFREMASEELCTRVGL